ncbi:MAG: hypothetical protein IKQ83_04450 [Lachnospiraceae bacterium]|jgi:hypothetical protein|nr:hypothetical protein [Lachnospiraceae bacterium]
MDMTLQEELDTQDSEAIETEESSDGYVTVTYEQMLEIRDDLLKQYDKIQEEKAEQERIYKEVQEEKAKQQEVYEKFIAEKTAFNEDMKALNAKVLQERKRLKEETMFFDKKMQILQNGFMQLDLDRKRLEREKAEFETVKEARSVKNAKGGTRVGGVFNASQFFIGVNSSLAVRKRYKDLLKIFHPDNLCGDESIVKAINEEYEKLRIEFNG